MHSVNGERLRIRENFATELAAIARKHELEAKALQGENVREALRATILTAHQLGEAESAWQLASALGHGEGALVRAVASLPAHDKDMSAASVRMDEAVAEFRQWLASSEAGMKLRPRTRENLRARASRLLLTLGRMLVSEVSADDLEKWLLSMNLAARSRQNYRLVASRLFSWCAERPRRWCSSNPVKDVHVTQPRPSEPVVLLPVQCKTLLRAAQEHRGGIVVPFLVIALYGGLRRSEIERLRHDQINLVDREIRIEASQSKTGRSRVIAMEPALSAWLEWCGARGLINYHPRRKDVEAVREAAGLSTWSANALRHTAISVKARTCKSFVDTSEWAGNSEPVIRKHYWGRMTSSDAASILAIAP